jgi:hypothetical protein
MVQQGRLAPEQLPAGTDKDLIGKLPVQTQVKLLENGIILFREMVGRDPVAFRAGNFGASMSTLDALEKVNMRFDSSFCAPYLGASCLMDPGGAINSSWQRGTVCEVPVTSFGTGTWSLRGLKPLNINAVSFWEMRKLLEQAERLGLRAVTFIAHSFSLFKAADEQFSRLRPDRLVLRRLERLCGYLRRNADRFPVIGFSNIETSALIADSDAAVPEMGSVVPALRKVVQGLNRLYWI